MINLYEEADLLKNPFQCFYYDSEAFGFPVAPHWHYYMEIVYVVKGNVKMQAENTEYILHPGDMILFHPKMVHAFYHADDNPVLLAVFKIDINSMKFTANYSPKLSNIFKAAEKKKKSLVLNHDYVQEMEIDTIFHHCIDEIKKHHYGYDIVVFGDLYRLLIMIVRYWQQDGFTIDQDVFAEEENYDIYNILPYISEHLDGDLKVTDIADSCGLSYSYFAKKFQSIYGKSCKEYIEDMRVYKAEQLLLFTNFDLTYISQITGFSDCSHMIRSFKFRKGITPKQFRMINTHKNMA